MPHADVQTCLPK